MTGRLSDYVTPFLMSRTLPTDQRPPHCLVPCWLSDAFLATQRPPGDYVHSAYLLLVAQLLGPISHLAGWQLAGGRIRNCSAPSWIRDTLLAVLRPPEYRGTAYHDSFFLAKWLHMRRKSKGPGIP